MFKALKRYISNKYYTEGTKLMSTAGLEELNKYGEPCHQHIHFNFHYEPCDLLNPKRALVSWLRNHAEKSGFELRGVATWCVQFFPDPEAFNDEMRFWRYPLKERPIPALCHLPDDHEPTLEELTLLARDERQRSIEANIIARDKAISRVTFKDKLFESLNLTFNPDSLLPTPPLPPNHMGSHTRLLQM